MPVTSRKTTEVHAEYASIDTIQIAYRYPVVHTHGHSLVIAPTNYVKVAKFPGVANNVQQTSFICLYPPLFLRDTSLQRG